MNKEIDSKIYYECNNCHEKFDKDFIPTLGFCYECFKNQLRNRITVDQLLKEEGINTGHK